jgi:hypothetical protein
MTKELFCDICNRSESVLQVKIPNNEPLLEEDEDGLWICNTCQKNLRSKSVAQESDDDLDEALQPLVGKSAGAICRTLELPSAPPYKAVIEAASNIAYDQDKYMSAWLFVTQWLDGTTVWRSLDGNEIAHVRPDGIVHIQNR